MWKIDMSPGCSIAHYYTGKKAICGHKENTKYFYSTGKKKFKRMHEVSKNFPVKKKCIKCLRLTGHKVDEKMMEAPKCEDPYKFFSDISNIETVSERCDQTGMDANFIGY